MDAKKLAELEYEACQAEKRDRMNARLQVWSLLIGLIGAFGLASIQSGAIGYVVVLYPLVAACVARFAGHSENVLNQVKVYLLEVERRSEYSGYESFNKVSGRGGVGNHMRALRDAIMLTDILAGLALTLRLVGDNQVLLIPEVVGVMIVVLILTGRWLRPSKKR